MVNPVLLVEVTSSSTEEDDGGEKLRQYKHLPSVREVLIVSHRDRHLTLHSRESDQWIVAEGRAGESITLSRLTATLAVDAVYGDELEDVG